MKRVLFGVMWFIIFFILLYIIYSIVVGLEVSHSMGGAAPTNLQQGIEAGKAFAQTHAHALALWRLVILIVSIVLAVAGTLACVLPGTRKKRPPAAANAAG
ncbi:MAG: hypothetical protein ACRETQ_03650 [Gammaproteobacteria bacterium]